MGNLIAANIDGADAEEFVPAHYSDINWPMGLRIDKLHILLGHEIAVAEINGETVKPYIPLDQLARFLNDHVQGAVENLLLSGGEGLEDGALRLLDEVTVGVERILDGRTLRTKIIAFDRLQLPSAVDPNKLLEMPTVRECPQLFLNLSLPQLPGPPPLFDNAALMEWLEQSDDRLLIFDSDCLSGPLSFLGALKENFQQATQVHSYSVVIRCPSINDVTGGLGVLDEELYNRLGQKMLIKVVADPTTYEGVDHPFELLQVTRVLPG